MNKILITGILGQDGANMAEYLLEEDYADNAVYGMMRRSATPNFINIESFMKNDNFKLVYGDLTDEVSINELVKTIRPDYLINFGANSFVGISWDMPMQVFDVNSLGVVRCLEAIRKFSPDCRFYSAGSSEEFGDIEYSPQDMKHPMRPCSPYGVSKCAAHHIVQVYRNSYQMYAVHGVLFNHEGTRRGEEFVTRKITKGVSKIYHELRDADNWRKRRGTTPDVEAIELGNLDCKRDWSDSEDFVDGVWLMLNQDEPKDYLLASGETHSIREFVEKAFSCADFDGHWVGEGLDEQFVHFDGKHKLVLVKVNPDFYRPVDVKMLLGDPSEALRGLGWAPKNSFDSLVEKMVLYDIAHAKKH